MHGSRYAAALTVFAWCHYDRRRHKRRSSGSQAIRNERLPKEVCLPGAEKERDEDDDEEEQAEQGADRGTPSLLSSPANRSEATHRVSLLALSHARSGKLIRGMPARTIDRVRSRSCVSASLRAAPLLHRWD